MFKVFWGFLVPGTNFITRFTADSNSKKKFDKYQLPQSNLHDGILL